MIKDNGTLLMLFVALILIGIGEVYAEAGSDSAVDRIKVVSPPNDVAEALKLASIRDTVFVLNEGARLTETGDLSLKQFFLGNPSKYQSSVNQVRLKFGRALDSSADQNEINFELVLSVKKKGGEEITLQHSKPRGPGSAVFKMTQDCFKKRSLVWFLGEENSSLFIIIPHLSPNSNVRGMLICPRGLAGGTLFTKNLLKDTGYQLVGLTASYAVSGHAELITGRGVGMVQIDLNNTSNLPRSQVTSDRAYGANPVADVNYYPDLNDSIDISASLDEGLAAIQLQTVLHYPVGHKRDTVYTDYVWAKKISIPKGPALRMKPAERAFEVTPDAGDCYSVIYQLQYFSHYYSTEELKVPDWVKAEPIKMLEE